MPPAATRQSANAGQRFFAGLAAGQGTQRFWHASFIAGQDSQGIGCPG